MSIKASGRGALQAQANARAKAAAILGYGAPFDAALRGASGQLLAALPSVPTPDQVRERLSAYVAQVRPDVFSLAAGMPSVSMPALPNLLPPLPMGDLAARTQAYLGKFAGAASAIEAAGNGDVVGAVAAAAAMAPPPYGPALAIGMTCLKGIGQALFSLGDAPRPPPQIRGVDKSALVNPFKNPAIGGSNMGVLAGKIAGGIVEVDPSVKEGVGYSAFAALHKTLKLMSTHRTIAGIDAALARLDDPGPASFRAVAYFAYYAGYANIVEMAKVDDAAMAQKIGPLIAWAAPRIQIREMLMYGFAAAKLPLGYQYARMDLTGDHDWLYKSFFEAWGPTVTNTSSGVAMSLPLDIAIARALPIPELDPKTGFWSYAPIPPKVLREELALYVKAERGGLTIHDAITPTDVGEFKFADMPGGGGVAAVVNSVFHGASKKSEWMDTLQDHLVKMTVAARTPSSVVVAKIGEHARIAQAEAGAGNKAGAKAHARLSLKLMHAVQTAVKQRKALEEQHRLASLGVTPKPPMHPVVKAGIGLGVGFGILKLLAFL